MRPEQNPLDLNNLPEEYGERWRDGKQILEESSLAAAAGSSVDLNSCRKKKNGKEGKEECGKVYECRFCSLKFCKSQALGGHMNRHRQERETETLNRARQLVFSNENLAGQVPHLGLRDPNLGMGDPSLPFSNLVYPRLPSASSSPMLSPQAPLQPYLYPSSSRLSSYPSPYPPSVNDYFVGHAFSGNSHHHPNLNYAAAESNYTCVGAPLAHSFPPEGVRPPLIGDGSSHNRTDGVNWSLNPPSINRFQDDF